MFTTVFTVAPHMLEFNGPDQNLPFALLPQPSSPPPPHWQPEDEHSVKEATGFL